MHHMVVVFVLCCRTSHFTAHLQCSALSLYHGIQSNFPLVDPFLVTYSGCLSQHSIPRRHSKAALPPAHNVLHWLTVISVCRNAAA